MYIYVCLSVCRLHNLRLIFVAVRLQFDSLKLDVYAVSIRTSDWLKHASDTHCQGDGFYDGILDKCLTADDVCEQATCSRPAVKHGDVICQGYAEGRQCHVTCKQGYV